MSRSRIVLGAAVALLTGCGANPFGTPPKISTDGFRARVTVREGGTARSFDLAVRGGVWRVDPVGGGPYTVHEGATKRATLLDAEAKTAAPAPFRTLDEIVPGHPLAVPFDEKAEAKRRGVESYAREGDEIFSGRACWLWRFADDPKAPLSPTTTYWVAPDLERLPVRVDLERAKADGTTEEIRSTQLTSVRIGAAESLFEVPASWRRAETGRPAR